MNLEGLFYLLQQMSKNRNLRHRSKIYRENNFTCQICKLTFPHKDWSGECLIHPTYRWVNDMPLRLELDHIIPLSKGGSDDIKNKQALCSACNNKKSDKILKQNG